MVSPANLPGIPLPVQQALGQLADDVNAAVAQSAQVLVFRPGGPTGNGYFDSWPDLMAALAALPNPVGAQVQIDGSTGAAISIPAGTWDMRGVPLSGPVISTNALVCDLEDGCVFENLFQVRSFLTLNCKSVSVPAFTLGWNKGILLDLAATIQNDPASSVPAVMVPAGTTSIIACLNASKVGSGTPCVQVDNGGGAIIALDLMAGLADNSVVGAGSLIVLLTSPSGTLFSSWPPVQPGVAGIMATSAQWAYLIGFSPPGLNPNNWVNATPLNVNEAVERMASLLVQLNGGNPIP